MTERPLVFGCEADELVGVLHAPAQKAHKPGVLIVVGGPQYRIGSHRQFVVMARGLAAAGHPVLRFDYRGMGDSSGEARSFEDIGDDIRAAMDAFHAELPLDRGVAIFGLCDAASAALMYCRSDARVRGLILANPWVRTEAGAAEAVVRHYYGQRLLQKDFWAKLFSGELRPLAALSGFFSSLQAARGARAERSARPKDHFVARMLRGLRDFGRPVLLLLSEHDLTAREFERLCDGSREWRQVTRAANVRRLDVAAADHTFSSVASLREVIDRSVQWLDECVSGQSDYESRGRSARH